MKKNWLSIIAFIFVIPVFLHAQENNPSKLKFKAYCNVYNNTYRQSFKNIDPNFSEITSDIYNSNVGDFSFGLVLHPEKSLFHEFELMPASFHKTKQIKENGPENEVPAMISGKEIATFNSRLRYQMIYKIIDKEKLDLNLGVFSQLFLHHDDFNSFISSEFSESFTSYGINLGFTPGGEIPVSSRIDLSFDFPIAIYNISNGRYKTENPAIPLENRKQNELNSEFGYQGFQARVGLGYKF